MVEVPDVEALVVVAIQASTDRIHPRFLRDLHPLSLLLPGPLPVIARPRFARLELEVVARQGQPIRAGHQAEGVAFQSFGGNTKFATCGAFANTDLEGLVRWFRNDRQPAASNLLQIFLKFLCPELSSPGRFLGNDNFRPWLPVLDEERFRR